MFSLLVPVCLLLLPFLRVDASFQHHFKRSNISDTAISSTASSVYTAAPAVDLGYGIYEGYYNATSNLNIYKG
jgi:hypothetical protein